MLFLSDDWHHFSQKIVGNSLADAPALNPKIELHIMATGFPDGFLWGASALAYQIEGAVKEDERGPSIWDVFSHLPGKIVGADTGDTAADHYHRWPEDIALMREFGLGAYRFSTAWPRILPEGRGRPNPKGLEFYDRLVDAMMAAGVQPWICLYGWDLPQALEYRHGWQNRDTASWFADYAAITACRLGDRVKHWATLHEPSVASLKGYGEGDHAPGIEGRTTALRAIHVMNLAHGLGAAAMRSERPDLLIGNIYNFRPHEPASEREEDEIAAAMFDALWNRSAPDPQIHGSYPEPIALEIEALVEPGDLDRIKQKLDYFAFSHSTRSQVRHDPDHPFEAAGVAPAPGTPVTEMGWERAPDAFRQLMIEVKERYSGDLPVYVLGNGAAFSDRVGAEGQIRDEPRIAYLRGYLGAVLDAIAASLPVRGYFARSFLDGFEWAQGYGKRVGLVHVDFSTLERRPKDSLYFYSELANGAPLERE
jgi:beta-glucosidase